jgi:hypothetical protein
MLTHLQNKIKALQSFSFSKELVKIVTDNKGKLADLQASQLAQGINSQGKQIYPQYAAFTISEKKKKTGLAGVYDRVTFFNTGELYKSLAAQIQGSKFRITSPSFKFDKMVQRSGVGVVGLNVDSRRDFIQEITRPEILEVYRQKVTSV